MFVRGKGREENILQKININKDWEFEKEGVKSVVSLPHTWNEEDGRSALADTKLVRHGRRRDKKGPLFGERQGERDLRRQRGAYRAQTARGRHHRQVVRQPRQTLQGEHPAQNSAYRSSAQGRGEWILADDKKE